MVKMKTADLPPSLLREYCQVSSCGGVIDFYEAKNLGGKIFWTISIVLALTATGYQTHEMVMGYWNGGQGTFQTTVTRVQMTNQTKFPYITICNFNRAMKSKLIRDGVDVKIMEYAFGSILASYDIWMGMMTNRSDEQMKEYQALWKKYSNGTEPSVSEMIGKYGHDCNITILRLYFNGFEMAMKDICENVEEEMTVYGRCWRYQPNQSQLRPGPMNGLQLTLNVALDEYPEDMIINNFLDQGLVLSIGYEHEPYPSNPIIIQPGHHAFIALSLQVETFTKMQHAIFDLPCSTETGLQYVNANYTLSNCRWDCLARSTAKYFGCVPLLNTKDNTRSCTTMEMLINISQYFSASFDYWTNKGHEKIEYYQNCESKCKTTCSPTYTITSTMSTSQLINNNSRKAIEPFARNILHTDINLDSLTRVDIYFPVLQYTLVDSTEATPITTFIANVGGNLGLWTGVCLMSIVQLFYYGIRAFFKLCACSANPKTPSSTPNPIQPFSIHDTLTVKPF